jgi:acetyl esterase/lipase
MKVIDFFVYSYCFILSILFKPYRYKGRSWLSEFICRITRIALQRSENKPIQWLRTQQQTLNKLLPVNNTKNNNSELSGDKIMLAGLPCYWYSSRLKPNMKEVIVYFHGGGYVMGGGDVYQEFCHFLANNTETSLVLLDYRLAPEYKYPTAHNDCFNMVLELFELFPDAQFQFAGDSAGGALLLATYQRILDPKRVNSLLLISPWIAPNRVEQSMINNESSDYLTHQILKNWLDIYCEKDEQYKLEQACDSFYFDASVPIYIQYSSHEILSQQINGFVEQGVKKGADITYDKVVNLFHNFQIIGMQTQEGQKANKNLVKFLSINKSKAKLT